MLMISFILGFDITMDQLDKFNRRYNFLSKLSAAFFYSIAVAIALNFFWTPGHMYSSGITGFAQLINTISERYLPFTLTTSFMYFILNFPLFILAWFKIGHKFTFFKIVCGSIRIFYDALDSHGNASGSSCMLLSLVAQFNGLVLD